MKQFVDDDEGYLDWLSMHPSGFVVNSERSPRPEYLVLHRATCGQISSERRANYTSSEYVKFCSDEMDELEVWAENEIGGPLSPCPCITRPTASAGRVDSTYRPGTIMRIERHSRSRADLWAIDEVRDDTLVVRMVWRKDDDRFPEFGASDSISINDITKAELYADYIPAPYSLRIKRGYAKRSLEEDLAR